MDRYVPGIRSNWLSVSIMTAVLVLWVTWQSGVEALLRAMFPGSTTVLYDRTPMWKFLLDHLVLTGIAAGLALTIGSLLGVFVLSRAGSPFRDLVMRIANFGQAIPTVALMAIAVPAIGYGSKPVLLALVIYSVLPVLVNVVVGIESVPSSVLEAGRGMGMTSAERFWQLQIPLALPVIMNGVRTMLVILVSAAAIGAVVGAGGLGVPILSGMAKFNNAVVIHGAIPAILLALIVDRSL